MIDEYSAPLETHAWTVLGHHFRSILSSLGQASESNSAEVLAGMLARSGRDAHYSEATHKRRTRDANQLALLRRDCQRVVVQQLYGAEELGLGQAMGLTGDDSSDLDSGLKSTNIYHSSTRKRRGYTPQ